MICGVPQWRHAPSRPESLTRTTSDLPQPTQENRTARPALMSASISSRRCLSLSSSCSTGAEGRGGGGGGGSGGADGAGGGGETVSEIAFTAADSSAPAPSSFSSRNV